MSKHFLAGMQTLTAKDAKYGFGRLIDLARAELVAIAKHGRRVVVMAVEEFERLKALDSRSTTSMLTIEACACGDRTRQE